VSVRKKKKVSFVMRPLAKLIIGAFLFLPFLRAGEAPNFITYTHQMEEPGNLELATKGVAGSPEGGGRCIGSALELEYGATAWWTTEVYLDGQTTGSDSALFTGFRWENRFRILPREHWINPVLYVEFENINGADKSMLEMVGHDGNDDLVEANDEARREKKREIETKLILGSYVKGWTIAENFIVEKNIRHEPWEFGYALAASRPLALRARAERCTFCPENFQSGVEMYGGLGTHDDFTLARTSQYIAPTIGWQLPNGPLLRFSPGFGLTSQSLPVLFRFSASYEVAQAGRAIRGMFANHSGNRP
jgi:hypothetical protein